MPGRGGQDHEPLSRVQLPYGEQAWLLVRYDDARPALADPRFSLAAAVARDVSRLYPGAGRLDP